MADNMAEGDDGQIMEHQMDQDDLEQIQNDV